MSDEKSQQQTSTESTVAGAAKTGKAISNIAKGAAAGGAHGAAIEAGKSSAKWLIPLIAAVLLPLILVAMLPSIIFGSFLGDGTDSPNGISNDEVLVQNTVTYLGTKIEPTKAEPTFKGAVLVISIIGGTALLAALLFLGLTLRKNTTVYKATGKGNEYEKCGRLHLKAKNPELRIDRLKDIPEGVIAIEVDQAVAKKLFGQTIAIHCYDNTVEHTVGTVNGQYWFKVDIGTQEGEPDTEEEPV